MNRSMIILQELYTKCAVITTVTARHGAKGQTCICWRYGDRRNESGPARQGLPSAFVQGGFL